MNSMSRYNDMQFLIAVIGALQNMRGNIEYIEQELLMVGGSSAKARVDQQCVRFNEFLDQAKDELDNLLQELTKLSATADKMTVLETIDDLKNFAHSFGRPLAEMLELVNDLKNLPPEESILFVLVQESTTSILHAEKEIEGSITNTIERISQRIQET